MLPDALAANFTLNYTGAASHARRTQEVPAFFADRRLSVMALYNGSAPWSGGDLTFVMPGGTNEVCLAFVCSAHTYTCAGAARDCCSCCKQAHPTLSSFWPPMLTRTPFIIYISNNSTSSRLKSGRPT